MRKAWPAKRARVRLGAGKIGQVPKPKKEARKKKQKIEEEKQEGAKEEEQPQAEETTEEETEEKEEETEEKAEETEEKAEETTEGVQETFGIKEDEERIKGTIKFFNPNKGFGFITGDDGEEYYVHQDALKEGILLEAADRVSFKVVEGDKGLKAEEVEKIGE